MNLASAEKEKIVEICKRNDISYCALFGSFARDEANDKSDIDLPKLKTEIKRVSEGFR